MQPLMKITAPEHAGRAKGPEVTVVWTAPDVMYQEISVDGGAYSQLAAEARSHQLDGLTEGVHTVTVRGERPTGLVSSSSTFYVYIPAQLPPCKLYMLDLKRLRQIDVEDPVLAAEAFDTLHCAAVLQGLVNRERPRMYVDYTDVDQFWLDRMRAKGSYLEHAELAPLVSLEDAVATFADDIKGAVVWDPDVPSTNNVASTVCGAENLLPVRYDATPGSLYDRLINKGPQLRIVIDLAGKFGKAGTIPDTGLDSTGSAKCDSYLWAKVHYLDTGRCNPFEIGYWCDAFWLRAPRDMSLECVGLTNHDFVVARRGFFCDLGVWTDEAPRDDPDQPFALDRETLCEILLSAYNASNGGIIHFSGFTPWAIKYTDHGNAGGKHGGVDTEWEMARICSAYNCYVDADAIGYVGMANASVFQHYPLPDRLVQNRPPTLDELKAKGYIDDAGSVAPANFIYHYLGDYDSAAWLYNRMPALWNDPVRGEVPSGWAFNPNLIERLPVLFDWCYDTKTPVDFFVAGDSGAGYVNPTELLPPREPSGLPSGADAWVAHNLSYFRRLNYSITGFLINGFCGELTDESNRMYTSFSGDGVMTQVWMPKYRKHDHLLDGMPVAHMKQDIGMTPEISIKEIIKHGKPGETAFLAFRSILQSPEWIRAVNDGVREARPECRFEPVDPYTYFYLLRHFLGGKNDKRATCTFDTMPAELTAGQSVPVTVGLRNDGWDTWIADGDDAVVLTARFDGREEAETIALPKDIRPGEGVVIEFSTAAPHLPGHHQFTLELRRGVDEWFGDAGDLPWAKPVQVG